MAMKWIRVWPDYVLHGTTFMELTAQDRGVWFSLLVLAGHSPVPGIICINEGIAYTDSQLSQYLKIPFPVLTESIQKLIEVEKITRSKDGSLKIVNWNKYQTEYDRQKGYRKGLQKEVTEKGYKEKQIQKQKQKKNIFVLPEWIPELLWNEWMDIRKRKKAINSPRAMNALIKQLEIIKQSEFTVEEAIEKAIMKSWKSIELEWLKNEINRTTGGTGGNRTAKQAADDYAARTIN